MYPAINRLLIALSIASLVLGEGTAHAGAPDEFNLLSQLPPELLRQCQACGDEDGLVGSNRNGLFIADEEREAMDGLVVGLILKHDSYVERCWRAVTATYDRQTPQGDFTGKRGSSHMRFWMAWSNHALYLLTKSPRYGPRYQDALHVLLPKVQRAMDYLTEYGPSQLSNDCKSPNRTLIIATAYELGARHPEVLSAVRDMSEENNGLPPVLITPRSARGVVGAPFSLSLGFTNAGLYELDPRFSVEAADLPPGLVLESHYDFTQSTGFATIKGTPSAPGSFQVKVTPQNQFGVNAPLFITLDIQ